MDAQVELALAKWPNVPHCYGWLALDARGRWRMRDDNAQRLNLPGDKITQTALTGFINRNYLHDEEGCWYFQNGPQRVYVDLHIAPFIAHTDPVAGFALHTGQPIQTISAVWLSKQGRLWLCGDDQIAVLDDRDLQACLMNIHAGDRVASDADIMQWLESAQMESNLRFLHDGKMIALQSLDDEQAAIEFGFNVKPRVIAE